LLTPPCAFPCKLFGLALSNYGRLFEFYLLNQSMLEAGPFVLRREALLYVPGIAFLRWVSGEAVSEVTLFQFFSVPHLDCFGFSLLLQLDGFVKQSLLYSLRILVGRPRHKVPVGVLSRLFSSPHPPLIIRTLNLRVSDVCAQVFPPRSRVD